MFGIRATLPLLLILPVLAQQGPNIPPAPTESVGCQLHGDHYHCDGPSDTATPTRPTVSASVVPSHSEDEHDDHDHENEGHDGHGDVPSTTTVAPSIPSPTESSNCVWHESHWDCFDSQGEAAAAQQAEDSGACVIHVGHTHGQCSAMDLACGRVLLEDYNLGLHVAAVFIILVTSALGVFIPLIAGWNRKGSSSSTLEGLDAASFGRRVGVWGSIFFLARHFGTGIIIATAFIHLLYHGFVMFQNECVGHLGFEATAPAIALAGAFVTFLFDFAGSRAAAFAIEEHSGRSTPTNPPSNPVNDGNCDIPGVGASTKEVSENLFSTGCAHDHAHRIEQAWGVLLLEAGIIFHSIMIGVTLGSGSGSGWTTLLIVLVFHQFFEGAALGARITLLWWISRMRAVLLACAFVITTPLGVAIGIAVRKTFAQNGKAALLSVGVLNSISAGILTYTAFKLLATDFTSGPLKTAPMRTILAALGSLMIGMIAMSVLGKWA